MRDQECKVTVHNVPEHASGYIVARMTEGSLWYWGCWDKEEDAEECARNVDGVVVEKLPSPTISKVEQVDDCISRQAVKDMLDARGVKAVMTFEHFKELLDKLPSVTPTRPTGKWKEYLDEGGFLYCECLNCGRITNEPDNYCPNCGSYNGGRG